MNTSLEQIKADDFVWLGDNREPQRVPRRVAKVTATQIVLDGNGWRYRRSNGRPVGTAMHRVTGVATAEEFEAWRAEQAEAARRSEERDAERRRREDKRRELNGLFGESAVVRESDGDGAGEWVVMVYASEDGVRRIAEALRDILG